MSGLQKNILGPFLPGAQNGNGGNAAQSTEETFTAGANQTVYGLSSQPNNVSIYLNEIKLVGANKYVLVNNQVTLTDAPFQGTIVTIRKY